MRRIGVCLIAIVLLAALAAGGSAEIIFINRTGEQAEETAAPEAAATADAPAQEVGGDETAMVFQAEGSGEAAEAADGVEILLTAAGDVTIGGNMRKNPPSNHYTEIFEEIDGNLAHFFSNVYDIFSQDDLTLVNFEGVLSTVTKHKDNEFTFRAPPEHVAILTLGSVEAVALENNHVMDFYEEGLSDTIEALTSHGIVYASEAHMGVFETKGVSIAMLAYQTFNNQYPRLLEQVPRDIAAAKESHDIVIVSYHWGEEKEFKPNDNQVKLGRATIDAGADLVLGHHSHRVSPIEYYNGKYIVYSLANCSFSGNSRPDNMDTFVFQQKFRVKDGEVTIGDFRIIPASISSVTGESGAVSGRNDLAITPFAPGSEAAQRVVNTMLENGKGLTYAVTSYPTEWQ